MRGSPLFGITEKHPDADLLFTFDWFDWVASYWRKRTEYSTSDFVRPNRATGFAYEATSGGQSGAKEPQWPDADGETVNDGDVEWTARAAGANGLQALSAPSVTGAPTGLTISNVAVDGPTVKALIAGGQVGRRYVVTCQATAGSETLVGDLWLDIIREVVRSRAA